MDYKRILLYGLLAVVLLLLWNAWQRDHHPMPAQTQTTQSHTAENKTTPIVSTTSDASGKTSYNQQISPPLKAQQVVRVQTDNLHLAISKVGGDIVEANLPRYPIALHSTQPFTLMDQNSDAHYTAQSGLKGFVDKPIHYHVAKQHYILQKGQKALKVVLQAKPTNDLQIAKIFTFHPNSYVVNVSYHITNHGKETKTGQWFMNISRTDVKPPRDNTFRIHTFYGFAMSSPQQHYKSYKFSKLDGQQVSDQVRGGWFAMTQHYFLTAWIPDKKQTYHYYTNKDQNLYHFVAESPNVSVLPGQTIETESEFYVGPKITSRLNAAAPYLSKTIDYGWLSFISVGIFWLMKHIHQIVGNWGWSIIIVTIIIKLIFWKLSAASYRSMAAMRQLQPKLNDLKERCGDDKQKFSREMMGLYKREKINPLGGCLPILIQIPFFIALYWVLIASVQLRQAPFIFWIHDLSAKDPYYVLPVLMGISMFVMQKLNPPPPDPTQAKIMMFLPVFVTVLFLKFPVGLILYMLVNNLVSIGQQVWVMKRYENSGPAEKQKREWQKRKRQNNKK